MKNFVVGHYYARVLGVKNRSHEVQSELPSLTVPDQSLSLRTLIERYSLGMDVPIIQGVYNDSEVIPDNLERMDQMERIELARSLKAGIALERQKMQDAQKAAQRAAKKPADIVEPAAPPVLPSTEVE